MITPAEFAKLASQLETKLHEAVAIGVAEAAVLVAEEAKHLIGHPQPEWPSLAPITLERKGADTPLLETGELRDSIEVHTGPTWAVIGSNDPKAVAHEHGTGHIPPRSFLATAMMHKSPEIVSLFRAKIRAALKGK